MGWLPTPRPRHPSAPEARTSAVAEVRLHVKIAILFSGDARRVEAPRVEEPLLYEAQRHFESSSIPWTRLHGFSKSRHTSTVLACCRTSLARVWLGLSKGNLEAVACWASSQAGTRNYFRLAFSPSAGSGRSVPGPPGSPH